MLTGDQIAGARHLVGLRAPEALAEAAGVNVPPKLAREGLAMVREATRAVRGLPPAAARQRALPRPDA